MTEKERIVEEIQKRLIKLNEMAITRSDFKDNIDKGMKISLLHLILCMVLCKDPEYNHWKGEIYGNFSRFKKLKYSNQYPSLQNFLDCGMETWFESIEDQLDSYIIEAFSKELDQDILNLKDIPYNIDVKKLSKYIKTYYEFTLNNIVESKRGLLNKSEAYKEIDRLVKEYNS